MSSEDARNVMMVSADRSVVAGERGPFYYMLESFSKHWDRVDVIGTRPPRREHERIFGNVHLHHPDTGKLRQAGFIRRTGLALAAARPYTVITSHDYNPFYNGYGSWQISKRTGIPYVAELHHVPGHPRPANLRERLDLRATRLYARWALKRAAGFRVVNAGELPPLLHRWGIPPESIHVLPSLYLDTEIFRPAPTPTRPECDVLFVGRLVPNKGLGVILEAVRRQQGVQPGGLKLRVLGRGPLAGWMQQFVARHQLGEQVEQIEWVEGAEDLAQLYRSARLLVCASTSEGGPRVVPEAMACGTPALTTPVGIVPDIIQHDVNGLVFDGEAATLAEQLERFFSDPALEARLCAALPPADNERFDRERVIAHLAAGLVAIADRARGSAPVGA